MRKCSWASENSAMTEFPDWWKELYIFAAVRFRYTYSAFPSQSNTLSVASPRELHRQITLFLCWKKTIALVLSIGEQSAQDIFEQWSIISKHNLWLSPTKQSFRRRRRILSTNVLMRLSIIDHSVRYIPHVYVTRMSFVLLSRWTKQLTTQPYNNEINIEKLCSTFAWLARDRLQ